MRFPLLAILLGGLLTPLAAVADEDIVEVPGMPVRNVGAVRDVTPGAAAAPAPAGTVRSPAEQMDPRELQAVIEAARADIGTTVMVAGPAVAPATLTAKSGVNEVIPIRLGAPNRIRTQFASPQVKHISETADIQTEGSIVYVSTHSPEPINLFIVDAGRDDHALSLTLLPRNVPPADIAVSLEGWDAYVAARPAVPSETATEWEVEQPYVEAITSLMRHLARGEVPTGYSLGALKQGHHPLMPHCALPGIRVQPMQVVEGGQLLALVARAENASHGRVTIDESACLGPGVLAVAAWPSVDMPPRSETEIYIVLKRPLPGTTPRTRPTLLGAAP